MQSYSFHTWSVWSAYCYISNQSKFTSAAKQTRLTSASNKLTAHITVQSLYIYPPTTSHPPPLHKYWTQTRRAVHQAAWPAYRQTTCTSHQHQNKKETLWERKMLLRNNNNNIVADRAVCLSVCRSPQRINGRVVEIVMAMSVSTISSATLLWGEENNYNKWVSLSKLLRTLIEKTYKYLNKVNFRYLNKKM